MDVHNLRVGKFLVCHFRFCLVTSHGIKGISIFNVLLHNNKIYGFVIPDYWNSLYNPCNFSLIDTKVHIAGSRLYLLFGKCYSYKSSQFQFFIIYFMIRFHFSNFWFSSSESMVLAGGQNQCWPFYMHDTFCAF
jgi:hypothetical protein